MIKERVIIDPFRAIQAETIAEEWLARLQNPTDQPCGQLDPETFFPPVEDRNGTLSVDSLVARAICQRCAVKNGCLSAALERREPHGIWGGLATKERENIKR